MEGGIAVRPTLTVETGPASGCRFRLDPDRPVRIGADESCEVCLAGMGLLPIHARLHFGPDGATIQPAESGVLLELNGQAFGTRRLLADGDRIGASGPDGGSVELRFRSPGRLGPGTEPPRLGPRPETGESDG